MNGSRHGSVFTSIQIQTLNKAFKSICYYAAEKGHHEQVSSEAALSLKGTAKSTVANLMFDPADYKCHYQVGETSAVRPSMCTE